MSYISCGFAQQEPPLPAQKTKKIEAFYGATINSEGCIPNSEITLLQDKYSEL